METTYRNTSFSSTEVASPDNSDPAVRRIYAAVAKEPGREWRMADLEEALPDLERRRIHACLMGMGRAKSTYPHLHRIARGVYQYDATRKSRVWVSSTKQSKTARKVAKKQKSKIVTKVKANNSAGIELLPTETIVMEDSAGNFYLLTPLKK
jgi:hypothetical protein